MQNRRSEQIRGSEQIRTEARLDLIRGSAARRRHDARTIAALTRNPGCNRRAVLDAAGVDKDGLSRHIGFAAPFGQSQFAIIRGNAFEARVRNDGGTDLLRLLADCLGFDLDPDGSPDDPPGGLTVVDLGASAEQAGGVRPAAENLADRLDRTVAALRPDPDGIVLVAHPLLALPVGGQDVHLEPDLLVIRPDGQFHVVEIKSFPVVDGQADGEKVAAAAVQAAVYVLALRRMLHAREVRPIDPPVPQGTVSHDVVLVCPRDFSNAPLATRVDVRRQLLGLEHQLTRLATIEALLDDLPADLTFDLAAGPDGAPTRPATELTTGLDLLDARYTPDCLSTCELAFRCRHEAAGRTAALGASVREDLGGIDTVTEALGLAHGTRPPAEDQAEAAERLRITARMYAEALAGAPHRPVGADG
ncbi:hypothetical protein [Parafrankia sp. FMc2]|uniref:hypothetical protein n=1 Tax=Parafrankia sp. FMc2 TaxID=3233196 RepID=UPI0034D59B8F